jgi:transcriptional regulator with XRE-family HTH domain
MKKAISAKRVKAARSEAGLTQAQAAKIIHTSINNWQNWEQGRYKVAPALYELFLLKTGQAAVDDDVATPEQTMGDRIRELRTSKGMTQTDLAEICGVTKAAVSAWETEYTENIRLRALLALTKALDTSVEYLVDG